MLSDDDIRKAKELVAGFRGRFFYDAERGDIGYIAKQCDDKQCDCERKLNADGEQDCSHSLSDWEGEDHINEPIVAMLNAVPALVDEVERLCTERSNLVPSLRLVSRLAHDVLADRAPWQEPQTDEQRRHNEVRALIIRALVAVDGYVARLETP